MAEPTARERATTLADEFLLEIDLTHAIEAAILEAERAAVFEAEDDATGYQPALSCCQSAKQHVAHRIARAERAAVARVLARLVSEECIATMARVLAHDGGVVAALAAVRALLEKEVSGG